jgi:alkylation response protein AidB-like acyl-CoA dehydrogenase
MMNAISPSMSPRPVQDSLENIVASLASEFAGTAAYHDRTGEFPFANFDRLSEAGLLTLTLPRHLGGQGAGLAEALSVIGGIARGEPSTALVLTMQYVHHGLLSDGQWPAEVVRRVAREAAEGVSLINALRVEPDLGTPFRGGLPGTSARRVEGGWRISGHKIYSTGIPILSWLVVWGRTNEEQPRSGQFLVPAKAPGVRIVETWDHLGMRASGSHDVIFEDVFIPTEHAVDIRPPSEWTSLDPLRTAWFTLLISAIYDGVARAARDWVINFAKTRTPSNLGAPLATLPRFQEAIGEIEGLLMTNRRLLTGAAADTDAGTPPTLAETGLIKLTVTRNSQTAVERALELGGNPGLSRANPLERHYRDVLCARVHSPQDDTVRLTAGRLALGV